MLTYAESNGEVRSRLGPKTGLEDRWIDDPPRFADRVHVQMIVFGINVKSMLYEGTRLFVLGVRVRCRPT